MPQEPGLPERPGLMTQLRQTEFNVLAEQAEEHRRTLLRIAAQGARAAADLGGLANPATDALAVQQQRLSEQCLTLAVQQGEVAQTLLRGESPANPPGL